jgi:hypothetical protein
MTIRNYQKSDWDLAVPSINHLIQNIVRKHIRSESKHRVNVQTAQDILIFSGINQPNPHPHVSSPNPLPMYIASSSPTPMHKNILHTLPSSSCSSPSVRQSRRDFPAFYPLHQAKSVCETTNTPIKTLQLSPEPSRGPKRTLEDKKCG